MSVACLAILAMALGGPTDKEAAQSSVRFEMVAVAATDNPERRKDEKRFDPALDGATKTALAKLPYNTFTKIASGKAATTYDREVSIDINEAYTLYLTPLDKGLLGRIRIKIRIAARDSEQGGAKKDALRVTLRAVPKDKIVLGGPRLKEGDLALVLTVSE